MSGRTGGRALSPEHSSISQAGVREISANHGRKSFTTSFNPPIELSYNPQRKVHSWVSHSENDFRNIRLFAHHSRNSIAQLAAIECCYIMLYRA